MKKHIESGCEIKETDMFTTGCCLICLSVRGKIVSVARDVLMNIAIKRTVRNWETK